MNSSTVFRALEGTDAVHYVHIQNGSSGIPLLCMNFNENVSNQPHQQSFRLQSEEISDTYSYDACLKLTLYARNYSRFIPLTSSVFDMQPT